MYPGEYILPFLGLGFVTSDIYPFVCGSAPHKT